MAAIPWELEISGGNVGGTSDMNQPTVVPNTGTAGSAADLTLGGDRGIYHATGANGRPCLSLGRGSSGSGTLSVNGYTQLTVSVVSASFGYGFADRLNVFGWVESGGGWGMCYFNVYNHFMQWRFGTGQSGNNIWKPLPGIKAGDLSIATYVKDGVNERAYLNGMQVHSVSGRLTTIANCGTYRLQNDVRHPAQLAAARAIRGVAVSDADLAEYHTAQMLYYNIGPGPARGVAQ